MDCRILRMLTLKSNGQLACDDSSGYGIILGEVSTGIGWDIRKVIDGPIYAHVRRSFAEGRVPWPGTCEGCHTFSSGGVAQDMLGSRIKLMIEPTLACNLGCPSCQRKREGKIRTGKWDLQPATLETLLKSCSKNGIEIEEAHYLGWGEPLLYEGLADLTRLVRKWHPHCVQEATTSGSVDVSDLLTDVDLDKLTVSCDGVQQASYERYRRGGDISKVFALLDYMGKLEKRPFVEWKYIVFSHNDSDQDLAEAQRLAEQFKIDSLLFILTHSKGASTRFTAANIDEFPLTYDRATVSPAAGMMTIKRVGRVIAEASLLGDREELSLYIDQVQITHSDILEVRGWSLRADGGYVDCIECHVGERKVGRAVPRERRTDVSRARHYATGPDCGFSLKLPLKHGQIYEALKFTVTSGNQQHVFPAVLRFNSDL